MDKVINVQAVVKENSMVSPYFLFFLIHGSQVGISVLNFQSRISKGAGQDAWVSVLAVGLSLNVIFFMMLHIMKYASNGDIISFHTDTFGKWIGGLLNLAMTFTFLVAGLLVSHSFIELLQVWVFNGIPSWEFALLICLLSYYIVSGGFRIVAGISFWGVVIPSFLLLSSLYLFHYREISYLLPIFNHGIKEYFISAKASSTMFFGFETVLVYFPFIKNQSRASKWGHLGLLFTTLVYLVITLVTFMFFTQGKLKILTWPTLTMIKIIAFPFLERFEFIFIFTWLFVILPVICIYLWSAIRTVKLTFPKLKPTYVLFFFICCYFFYSSILEDIYYTKLLIKIVRYNGFILLFGYIPLLFIISLIKVVIKNRKQQSIS
ncbi:GerAB/ArcD/ProY family transporter [Bacillus sp. FJAT-29814]|uniref:GerAB/ArcD/ProY family transporter n=1 Tax=Bacillus sp. FJAT-29814 TaxID=1729688 RepID=UPI000830C204|nr:GerAB/ArcD/ProY family transporter [Bacillus sp. FJAT-29814]